MQHVSQNISNLLFLVMPCLDGPVDLSSESLCRTWTGHGYVMLAFCIRITKSEVGKKDGVPNRESKPSAHAPAPHARHDRSMARSVSVARPILHNFLPGWATAASNVQRPAPWARAAFCHTYKLILTFLEPMESSWIQHVNKT